MKINVQLSLLILLLLSGIRAQGVLFYVKSGSSIPTIQSALKMAQSGDTIKVSAGVYREGALHINKKLTFLAEGKAVLDGESKHPVLIVRADFVVVDGFTIQNTGKSDIEEYAAIRVENAKACVISNNKLYNSFFGIYIANSHFCKILNNRIKGFAKSETSSGNGIHLWKSDNHLVYNNHISGHRDGIYFEFVKNSTIIGNLSENNLRYGLHFMFSDKDSYSYNTFRRNGSGVAVMYTRNVIMEFNVFDHNWGSSAYGLLLKDIGHSQIRNNYFFMNTTALYMEGCGKTMIRNNNFRKNGWAIRLLGDCYEDTLTNNNFIGNTFDLATNASQNLNLIEGNYWDKYRGYDLDKNGRGDIPYNPLSLYTMLIEDSPHTLMLLHSFFVELMDQAEKVMPSLTPSGFRDLSPVMKFISHD